MNRRSALTYYVFILTCIIFPVSANAFCWEEAAKPYGHDPRLLAAIAEQESHYRVAAVGPITKSGGQAYGMMQIFSTELPGLAKRGISKEDLLNDACLNVREGARILAEKIKILGPTWEAVGAYYAGEKGSRKGMERYVEQVKVRYLALLNEPLPKADYRIPKRRWGNLRLSIRRSSDLVLFAESE